jgi:hypothetical protein
MNKYLAIFDNDVLTYEDDDPINVLVNIYVYFYTADDDVIPALQSANDINAALRLFKKLAPYDCKMLYFGQVDNWYLNETYITKSFNYKSD